MPSPAPGPRGVRAIKGYRAELDAAALGLEFEALVFVTLRGGDRESV